MAGDNRRLGAAGKRSYLRNAGKCPYCGSISITGESVEIESASAWQEVSCQECGKRWRDIYTLTNVEEVS